MERRVAGLPLCRVIGRMKRQNGDKHGLLHGRESSYDCIRIPGECLGLLFADSVHARAGMLHAQTR